VIKNTEEIFGERAFRKFNIGSEEKHNGEWNKSINKGLYDVTLWGYHAYDDRLDEIIARKDMVREHLIYLMSQDQEFIKTITLGTDDNRKVKKRGNIWHAALGEILNAPINSSVDKKIRQFEYNPVCAVCEENIKHLDDAVIHGIKKYWLTSDIPEKIKLAHRFCSISSRGVV
jgi:hypothetical protein